MGPSCVALGWSWGQEGQRGQCGAGKMLLLPPAVDSADFAPATPRAIDSKDSYSQQSLAGPLRLQGQWGHKHSKTTPTHAAMAPESADIRHLENGTAPQYDTDWSMCKFCFSGKASGSLFLDFQVVIRAIAAGLNLISRKNNKLKHPLSTLLAPCRGVYKLISVTKHV